MYGNRIRDTSALLSVLFLLVISFLCGLIGDDTKWVPDLRASLTMCLLIFIFRAWPLNWIWPELIVLIVFLMDIGIRVSCALNWSLEPCSASDFSSLEFYEDCTFYFVFRTAISVLIVGSAVATVGRQRLQYNLSLLFRIVFSFVLTYSLLATCRNGNWLSYNLSLLPNILDGPDSIQVRLLIIDIFQYTTVVGISLVGFGSWISRRLDNCFVFICITFFVAAECIDWYLNYKISVDAVSILLKMGKEPPVDFWAKFAWADTYARIVYVTLDLIVVSFFLLILRAEYSSFSARGGLPKD